MEYLPAEIQLKIFKNFNFNELHKMKQINKYFCEFINKYKDEFPPKIFKMIHTVTSPLETKKIKLLPNSRVKDMANNFSLNNHLKEKWLSALDKKMPVFLLNASIDETDPLLALTEEKSKKKDFALKLPLKPKNIEELKIVRYWLEQISNCVFDTVFFSDFLFNPKIIKLLFDNEEMAKLKFNCRRAIIFLDSQEIVDLKFTFDLLVISGEFILDFQYADTTEDEIILLNLLFNEGGRIPTLNLNFLGDGQILLYEHVINHLEKSKDLTKMVAKIEFNKIYWPCSELNVRGIELTKSNNKEKCYKITNINDTKMKFSILFVPNEFGNNLVSSIKIAQIK